MVKNERRTYITTNKLTDDAYNNDDIYTDNGNAENAVIKAKAGSDVTIGGTGTLIVTGNGKNGIKAANKLTIEDVNLTVTAENNAIASDTEMLIKSGTIYAAAWVVTTDQVSQAVSRVARPVSLLCPFCQVMW